MPIDNGICSECESNELIIIFNLSDDPRVFELQWLASPITFKDKKHLFENCLELEWDKELDAASKTSEWHLCKLQQLYCERVYNKDEEYCAKHNKECLHFQCKSRQEVNSENYCPYHAKKCEHCQVRKWVNNESFCSEHQYKCGSCELRTNKEYCSQHTYECYVNDGYPFKWYSSSCSERVAEFYFYCANHYWVCENYNCRNRISGSKSLCDACQTTDLCLNDCGKRIPKHTTYCTSCQEQDELKDLVKQRTNLQGLIHEVERFKTWWNNNLATIITINDNDYWVFLGVIDRKPNNTGKIENNEIFIFPTNHNDTKWGIYSREGHDLLRNARAEASWLRTKLNGDNPILVIHPQANSWTYFSNIVCEPYVKKEYLPSSAYSNPSQYLKPLDIIWVERRFGFTPLTDYQHVGVYIGNSELIHIEGNVFDKKGVRKTSWSEFLKKREGSVSRYSPIIPFKHYKEIIGQLIWAKDNNFREGSYNLKNRNCEHFSNMAVLNINYSQQVKEKGNSIQMGDYVVREAAICNGTVATTACVLLTPATCGLSLIAGAIMGGLTTAAALDTIEDKDFTELNNGKGTICLRKEKEEVESKLGKKSNKETENFEKKYQAQIEQPVNIRDCIIM